MYYKRGFRKIIPEKLIPVSKPVVLDYIYNLQDQETGIIGGIFLKSCNTDKNELIKRLIRGINSINQKYIHNLILEELYLFNKDDLEYIENKTGLQIISGINVVSHFLALVLERIYEILEKDLRNEEVLIIGNQKEQIKTIIEDICKKVRFITLAGNYNDNIDNFIEEILEKTGLSVFYSKSIEKILPNYSIIINLDQNPNIDIDRIRRQVIIFDLSPNKIINKLLAKEKGIKAIEDFIFRCNQLNIIENEWMGQLVPSYVYEYFQHLEFEELEKLYIDGDLYSIGDFANDYIRARGRL